jgi:hypothetical protein
MYYKKYLKYKQKYAYLKDNFINQLGGNRKILFTFNNDYKTVYVYNIQSPEDDFIKFKNLILNNIDDKNIEIFEQSTLLTTNENFGALPPFTILNICTKPDNIKQDILKCMVFDLPEPLLDGDATPLRRTKSYDSDAELSLLQKKKPLNLFLYDVGYSQINFYKNNNFLICNWQTADFYCDPKIVVLFDSGNSGKTLIPRSFARKLQCEIILTRPQGDFIQFYDTTIRALLQGFEDCNLYQYLLRSQDLDSRTIYDYSKPFLDMLKQNYIGFYNQFIEKLNLEVTGGVNSKGAVIGFEKTTFQFLINGTEDNFKNRKGIIIPLSVDAWVEDDDQDDPNPDNYSKVILINDKTIETLEYYRLFINVDDKHKICHENEMKLSLNKSRRDAITKGISKRDVKEKDLEVKIETRKTEKRNLELVKLPVINMKCKDHFYKIDIKKTSILLKDNANQFVQPVGDYTVIFDTGNSATTLISPEFIRKNDSINFNRVDVKPFPPFYEILENLITKNHDVQLKRVLSRWRNKQLTSAQIYGEFIGSTPLEFQQEYKDIFIGHLNLIESIDVSNVTQVKGGTKYSFGFGIDNFPGNIQINAISTECIMQIDIFSPNPVAPPQPQAVPFDILISVDETKKLNDQLCFIGNIQIKNEFDRLIAENENEINRLLGVREVLRQQNDVFQIRQANQQIKKLMDDIKEYKNQKYGAEITPCINPQFFIKKFYEDVLLIVHKKLGLILRESLKDFDPIKSIVEAPKYFHDRDLLDRFKQNMEKVNMFIEKIQLRPTKDMVESAPTDILIKTFEAFNGKKQRFLLELRNAIDTANQIKNKYELRNTLPKTADYKINDKYI